MRRMLSALVASAMLGLALPALAAAHHRHHGRHGAKHHASSARFETFRAASAPAGSPSSPTTPSGPQEAGKVATFEKGVLTITLAGGKETVSGKVTENTELHCQPATPPAQSGDDQNEGGDGGAGPSGDQGESSDSSGFANAHGDSMAHSADFQDDQDGQDGGQEACTTALLTPETVVVEAELELTSSGAVWEKVDIVH